jgi:ATP-dependent Clp protease protease subunit
MGMQQGMSLVPSVTELILAELLYLQYENADKPITMYINSTGTTKVRMPFAAQQ